VLAKTLDEVRARIARAGARGLNEMDTRATLIEPVLAALGWDVHGPAVTAGVAVAADRDPVNYALSVDDRPAVFVDVVPCERSDKPVDFALLLMREPKLFVEAKGLGGNLDDRKWANQIMGYAAVAGVEWIVLTDGDEYRIYNAGATVRVEEKLLCTAKVSAADGQADAILRLFEKDQIGTDRLAALWQADFVDRQVRAALDGLFDPDDDAALVRQIRRSTKDLPPSDIRRSLRRCQITIDFPDASGLLSELAESKSTGEAERPARGAGDETTPGAPQPASAARRSSTAVDGVSVADLLSAGVLRPGACLWARYKGHELEASVAEDGSIVFQDTTYASLSQAGGAARATVIGLKDGKVPATNGWDFWRCEDSGGRAVKIGVLRAQAKGGEL